MSLIDKLPGIRRPNNRKSPYGELNWIFTAITDSIAWNVLPRELFQKLFRQDLLVASLFRNFLLAQRIMHSYHCTVSCKTYHRQHMQQRGITCCVVSWHHVNIMCYNCCMRLLHSLSVPILCMYIGYL